MGARRLSAIKPMSKSSAVSSWLKLMLLVMLIFRQHQIDSRTMIGLYSILLMITPRKLISLSQIKQARTLSAHLPSLLNVAFGFMKLVYTPLLP
jgi:hypothetical protein